MERGSSLNSLEGGRCKLSGDEDDALILPNILSLSLSCCQIGKRDKPLGSSLQEGLSVTREGSKKSGNRTLHDSAFCCI